MTISFSLLRTSDFVASGLRGDTLLTSVRRGDLQQVSRGVFMPSADWARLDARGRHLAKIHALLDGKSTGTIVSHESAAALHGFPVLDSWPDVVHVIDPRRATGGRSPTMVRHPGADEFAAGAGFGSGVEVASSEGLVCTSPARTAVDLAVARGVVVGVLGFDFGLRTKAFSRDDLRAVLGRRCDPRRRVQTLAAIEFASAGAQSAGESISRIEMSLMGFPRAVLQQEFPARRKRAYFADFWWPDYGVVGEFDGTGKYVDPVMLAGRTTEQALLDEKWRDEELRERADVRTVVHWGYATARNRTRLAEVLVAAGLPRQGAARR